MKNHQTCHTQVSVNENSREYDRVHMKDSSTNG